MAPTRVLPAQPIQVGWGDGDSQLVPWTPYEPRVPTPRHTYRQPEDLAVTVQVGMLIATLAVALIGCPVPCSTQSWVSPAKPCCMRRPMPPRAAS
jgi:hypothetical protein